jgi:hypothetical protein
MIQRPNAVGLVLCEDVIVEEGSRSMSLIKSLSRLEIAQFPSGPRPFTVFAILTDGLGEVALSLKIARLDTFEEIYSRTTAIAFTNPLSEIRMFRRVASCSFPVPGRYQISLMVGQEEIAQCVLTVLRRRTKP